MNAISGSQSSRDRVLELLSAQADGWLGDEQRDELLGLLRRDPEARAAYAEHAILNSLLFHKSSAAGSATIHSVVGGAAEPPLGVDVDSETTDPVFPGPFPYPTLSATHYPPSTNFVGGPVFSYMVATVVLCMMLLGAWAYKVSRVDHFPGGIAQTPIVPTQPTPIIVGRITGMKKCVWSDTDTSPLLGAYVRLNRKYALSSGLLEITYGSGARVILEGPCNYTVDSRAGGYLEQGKLTARVDKAKPQAVHPSSLGLHPLSLFTVTTPTAIVTDLGTEFGVEVDASGDCWTYVFQGKVELTLTNAGENQGPVRLGENDSVRVIGRTRKMEMTRDQSPTRKFARSIPKRVRLELHNTGVGLQEGDADAHWHIIAMSGDPDFKPGQAVVTATPPYDRWLWNQPRRGQWVSLSNGPDDIPSGTYTFRTTFQLGKDGLNATAISGSFWADNHVDAIRINGRSVKVPEHGYNIPFVEPVRFVVNEGFVEGENVLEFDVFNGGGDNAFPDAPNPMGLRVQLEGVSNGSTASAAGGSASCNSKKDAARPRKNHIPQENN